MKKSVEYIKKSPLRLILISSVFIIFLSNFAGAVSIGISPGRLRFEGLLREGYAERTITITTGSDDDLFVSFKPQGNIGSWIRFEPNATLISTTRGNPYKLNVIIEPPDDIPTGNYTGSIEFVTEGLGGVSGRAGALIKTAVTLLSDVEVIGEQIVDCRAGAFSFNDAEQDFPFEFSYNVINDGNVRLNPTIKIDFWDQLQEELLFSREIVGDLVLPTTQRTITGSIENPLAPGQYWTDMQLEECQTGSLNTFSVVEKGGIIDKGVFNTITNKQWAYTDETVEFIAKFSNTGQRSVNARFEGAIRLNDRIVKLIETDEVIVPAGENLDFSIFFVPVDEGRYTLNGRINYNKKLTFEKGTVLNVEFPPETEEKKKFSFLPLLLYLIILITILFIVRKIMKEKKKKKIF
jgi:hypothetical protein